MRLALDTAFSVCSVALADPPGNLLGEAHLEQNRGQAETLLPMVSRVLIEAGIEATDITEVIVNIGPGTFAGVRVATSCARALALAGGARTMGITAFEALAGTLIRNNEAGDGDKILALVPGKRGEVSAQLYRVGKTVFSSLKEPETMPHKGLRDFIGENKVIIAGPGLDQAFSGAMGLSSVKTYSFWPTAVDLLGVANLLGEGRFSATVSPFYLRPADAKPQKPRLFLPENA